MPVLSLSFFTCKHFQPRHELDYTKLCLKRDHLRHLKSSSFKFSRWQRSQKGRKYNDSKFFPVYCILFPSLHRGLNSELMFPHWLPYLHIVFDFINIYIILSYIIYNNIYSSNCFAICTRTKIHRLLNASDG